MPGVLMIDNFNDLLGSIHDPEPLHRLRAFLMKESHVMQNFAGSDMPCSRQPARKVS